MGTLEHTNSLCATRHLTQQLFGACSKKHLTGAMNVFTAACTYRLTCGTDKTTLTTHRAKTDPLEVGVSFATRGA